MDILRYFRIFFRVLVVLCVYVCRYMYIQITYRIGKFLRRRWLTQVVKTETLSICLSKYLDVLIGHKETVAARRRCYKNGTEFFTCGDPLYRCIFAGSSADGFDLKDSDFDQMFVFRQLKVTDSTTWSINASVPTLQMIYASNAPGSVLLKVVNPEPLVAFSVDVAKTFVRFGDQILVSSSLFRDTALSVCKQGYLGTSKLIESGPCVTVVSDESHADLASAFHCSSWPSIATEWIHRHRPNGWPHAAIITDIMKDGCYVVPISDSAMENSDILWRISFATAETKLVHSLNHVQFKVYAMLKIFLNDVLKKHQKDEEPLLCSYFMKTIIFYAVENSPSTFWTDSNFINCFFTCYNMLINCADHGYMPNYFIPSNNMLRKRIHGQQRTQLLFALVKYENAMSVFECSLLKPLKGIMDTKVGLKFMLKKYATAQVDIEARSDNFALCQCASMAYVHRVCDTDINYLFKLLTLSDNKIDYCFSLLQLQNVLACNASSTRGSIIGHGSMDNKAMYNKLRLIRHYLTFGVHADLTQGWLTLASYHYTIGQYKTALKISENVIATINPSTIYCYAKMNDVSYTKKYCGKGISLDMKLKHAFADYLSATKWKVNVLPTELNLEFICDPRGYVSIPPISYAMFLSFLCYSKTQALREMQGALTALQENIEKDSEKVVDPVDKYILYSMLGICHEIIGDEQNATVNFLKSFEVFPSNLATFIRLKRRINQ